MREKSVSIKEISKNEHRFNKQQVYSTVENFAEDSSGMIGAKPTNIEKGL